MSWDWITALHQARTQRRRAVLVTITRVQGSAPRDTGAKMLVFAGNEFEGTIGGGRLEQLALDEARALLSTDQAAVVRYPLGPKAGQCCAGVVELLFEPILPALSVYIYGAGHVGRAVCCALEGTRFEVHAVDEREEWLNHSRMPASIQRHLLNPTEFNEKAQWGDHVYALIMTHRHDLDELIVADCLRRKTAFIGLIGSHSKWARFQLRLMGKGFSATDLSRVHCPVGLGRWGKAPQEVALSIAADLLARTSPALTAARAFSQERMSLSPPTDSASVPVFPPLHD